MAGTALQNFLDFAKMTGPAFLTGPDALLNEAVKQSYSISRFLRGRGMDEVIQSGDRILDDVMFDEANTFINYQPNEEFNYTQPQVITEQAIDWRFSFDHMSFTEHEVILNAGSRLNRRAAAVQYKRIKKKMEMRVSTSIINGMEKKLWQLASSQTGAEFAAADMESQGGTEQFSIPNFISDDPNNFEASGWTTLMSINPANEARWRNQRETYAFADPDDQDSSGDGLYDAFDNMHLKVQFVPPEFEQENFESLNYEAYRQAIFASRKGVNLYKRLLRASNDLLVTRQDAAYVRPQYGGIDIVYVTQMDAGTVASGGTGHIFDRHTTDGSYVEVYDEDGNNAAGSPVTNAVDGNRFYWCNGNYLIMVFHGERYFRRTGEFTLDKQPFTHVAPVDTWWNTFLRSRQRQGIVSPSSA